MRILTPKISQDLEIGESIGEGAFGTVHKGTYRATVAVAIKILRFGKPANFLK